MHKYKVIMGSAMLAAVSVLLQIYKLGFSWAGIIDIDLVGVPWLVSTFLFGLSGGLLTSFVSALGIAVFAPTGPIGSFMKLAATVIMVLIVGGFGKAFGFGKKPMAAAFVICLVARPVVMTAFNYFWAVPLFFSIPTEVALQEFPPEVFLIPNAILAVVDFWVAYALIFGTRLKRRLNA